MDILSQYKRPFSKKLAREQNIDFCGGDVMMSYQLEEGGSIAREVEVSISVCC